MTLSHLPARVLDDSSLAAVHGLLARDVAAHCVLASRVEMARSLDPYRLGGQVWTSSTGADLSSACYVGGTVMPIGRGPEGRAGAADIGARLAGQRRMCSSIVGTADNVLALWAAAERGWGPARLIRDEQPLLMSVDAPPAALADPQVRVLRAAQADAIVPAAAAMFTEELKASPYGRDGGAGFRNRIRSLAATGRILARFDDGEAVFKAEIGSVSAGACQIQGVWVRPDLRGQGIGTAAMAAVLRYALTLAPVATLYVNGFNTPARAVYGRLGMRQVGTFATVLF
ncbi:MAG: GCN5-related N-acetyltransferase [Pseudonocardiales bacterium]|nr:GCN5-related N-acetyltransferase [Pseudonocardiales bacterium]